MDPNEPIRLNKFLANAGVCSRREADEFITAGVVSGTAGYTLTAEAVLPTSSVRIRPDTSSPFKMTCCAPSR